MKVEHNVQCVSADIQNNIKLFSWNIVVAIRREEMTLDLPQRHSGV